MKNMECNNAPCPCQSKALKTEMAALLLVALSNVNLGGAGFDTIHSFSVPGDMTGRHVTAQLVQGPDGLLYGTAERGAGNIRGTVFKVHPDGSGFVVLKAFTNAAEGATPAGGLTLIGTALYGRTSFGGDSNAGSIFRVNTDGTGYTVLKSFTGSDGSMAYPSDWWQSTGSLLVHDSRLYGTTPIGGDSGGGTVFRVNLDGSDYTVLKHFSGAAGDWPIGSLVTDGNNIYGTTFRGGAFGYGTVFKVSTDGTEYTVLRSFDNNQWSGWNPVGGLVIKGNILYGTTADPGTHEEFYETGYLGAGTVFRINTDGTAYFILKKFTENEGFVPLGTLLLDGSVLYGTTHGGYTGGTVFKINTDASGYATLLEFSPVTTTDGYHPYGGLVLNGSTLYGTTSTGLPSRFGTLFKVKTDGTGYAHLMTFGELQEQFPASVSISGGTFYGTMVGDYWQGGTVYKFAGDTGYSSLKTFIRDGHRPSSDVVVESNYVYGTTYEGYSGSPSSGLLYRLRTDGSNYTVLKDFVAEGSGAQYPRGQLVLDGGTLFGTTEGGGLGRGTVYKIRADGTGYQVLKSFTGSDGAHPYSGLSMESNTLYGAAADTLYKLKPDGSGFSVVHKQGEHISSAIVREGVLYAISKAGPFFGQKVFKVNTDGSGYTVLKSFPENGPLYVSALEADSRWVYGSVNSSGDTNYGMIFQLSTDGRNYSALKIFAGYDGDDPSQLKLNGGLLYGITQRGGEFNQGTIFRIDPSAAGIPSLNMQSLRSHVVLSWNNTAFRLQSSGDPAGGFTNLPAATSPFTNKVAGPQQYFRLLREGS